MNLNVAKKHCHLAKVLFGASVGKFLLRAGTRLYLSADVSYGL